MTFSISYLFYFNIIHFCNHSGGIVAYPRLTPVRYIPGRNFEVDAWRPSLREGWLEIDWTGTPPPYPRSFARTTETVYFSSDTDEWRAFVPVACDGKRGMFDEDFYKRVYSSWICSFTIALWTGLTFFFRFFRFFLFFFGEKFTRLRKASVVRWKYIGRWST